MPKQQGSPPPNASTNSSSTVFTTLPVVSYSSLCRQFVEFYYINDHSFTFAQSYLHALSALLLTFLAWERTS